MQALTDYNLTDKVMCNLWHWIYHLNDIIGDMNVVFCMKNIFSYKIDAQLLPDQSWLSSKSDVFWGSLWMPKPRLVTGLHDRHLQLLDVSSDM